MQPTPDLGSRSPEKVRCRSLLPIAFALSLASSLTPANGLAAGVSLLDPIRHWGVGSRLPAESSGQGGSSASSLNPAKSTAAALRWGSSGQGGRLPQRRAPAVLWLRGGQGEARGDGGFKARVVPRAQGMRPKIGVQVGEGVAGLIGAASVALFALGMPPVFSPAQATGSFWLTRILFLRALGLVYFTAFLVSFRQSEGLIGDRGLLPATLFLQRAREESGYPKAGVTPQMINEIPTLLWSESPLGGVRGFRCINNLGVTRLNLHHIRPSSELDAE